MLILEKSAYPGKVLDLSEVAGKNAGNREEAVKNYETSLQINPDNEGGKRMLKEIRAEKP